MLQKDIPTARMGEILETNESTNGIVAFGVIAAAYEMKPCLVPEIETLDQISTNSDQYHSRHVSPAPIGIRLGRTL